MVFHSPQELESPGREPASPSAHTATVLDTSIAIMARLRAPNGCPWDREQTFDSIKRHTLEETYEVFDAIERRAWPDLKDELGDLLLQVLFYAQMAEEAGYFNIHDVAASLNAKLIRRHPHVFGDAKAADSSAVLRNWEQVKQQEKQLAARAPAGLLDDVARSMPAMMEAGKLGSRASKVGFDWPDADGLFGKLQEEICELKAELALDSPNPVASSSEAFKSEASNSEAVEGELGDLLFTVVNLARHLKVDPENALRSTNAKFRQRFARMEAEAGGAEALRSMSPPQLEDLWDQAKRTARTAHAESSRR